VLVFGSLLGYVKIIVLTSFSDQNHVLPAIRAGANGYLLKDIEPEELVKAIRRVRQGQVALHPEATEQLMNIVAAPEQSSISNQKLASSDLPNELTNRENEVLQLIASGMSNREISEVLVITEKTVKTHVSHLLDKLGLSDRTQAAIYAVKRGLGK
jgi:DNA-binding NarL/FixJ family response regulator